MLFFFSLAAVTAVIFVNGWTDAPNAVASAVGARSMTPQRAVMTAAVFNLFGAVSGCFIGGGVARAVYSIADFEGTDALTALTAGMTAVALWAVVAWYFGIPTSESHAMLAGVGGAAVALGGSGALNVHEWGRVGIGLLLSTVPAFLAGNFIFLLAARLCRKRERGAVMPLFIWGQKLGAASGAYLHGLQDGQKFMGIMMLCMSLGRGIEYDRIPIPLAVFSAVVMALGTAMGGSRIIKKVAMDMVKLDAPRGFCADVSASAVLLVCTILGLPVSTTHAKTCAVMGAGGACRRGALDYASVRDMVAAWIITFPLCFVLGFSAAKLLLMIE